MFDVNRLTFLKYWSLAVNGYIAYHMKEPKALIVNLKDLETYEEFLATKYEGGIIPIVGGVLRYKNIPLGFAETLAFNECAIEESK